MHLHLADLQLLRWIVEWLHPRKEIRSWTLGRNLVVDCRAPLRMTLLSSSLLLSPPSSLFSSSFLWFIFIYVCICPQSSEEVVRFPRIEITGGYETSYRCWDLNLGPLENGHLFIYHPLFKWLRVRYISYLFGLVLARLSFLLFLFWTWVSYPHFLILGKAPFPHPLPCSYRVRVCPLTAILARLQLPHCFKWLSLSF